MSMSVNKSTERVWLKRSVRLRMRGRKIEYTVQGTQHFFIPWRSNCTHSRGNVGRRGRSLCAPPEGVSVCPPQPPVRWPRTEERTVSWKAVTAERGGISGKPQLTQLFSTTATKLYSYYTIYFLCSLREVTHWPVKQNRHHFVLSSAHSSGVKNPFWPGLNVLWFRVIKAPQHHSTIVHLKHTQIYRNRCKSTIARSATYEELQIHLQNRCQSPSQTAPNIAGRHARHDWESRKKFAIVK